MKLSTSKTFFVSLLVSTVCCCGDSCAMNIKPITTKHLKSNGVRIVAPLHAVITAERIENAIRMDDKEFLLQITDAHGSWQQFNQHPDWLERIIKGCADDEMIILNIAENAWQLKHQRSEIMALVSPAVEKIIDRAIDKKNKKSLLRITNTHISWQQFKQHPAWLEKIIASFDGDRNDDMIVENITEHAQRLPLEQQSRVMKQLVPGVEKMVNRAINDQDTKRLMQIIGPRGNWQQFKQNPDLLQRIMTACADDEMIIRTIFTNANLLEPDQRSMTIKAIIDDAIHNNKHDFLLYITNEQVYWQQFRPSLDSLVQIITAYANDAVIIGGIIQHAYKLGQDQQDRIMPQLLKCVKVFQDNGSNVLVKILIQSLPHHDSSFIIQVLRQHTDIQVIDKAGTVELCEILKRMTREPYPAEEVVTALSVISELLAKFNEHLLQQLYRHDHELGQHRKFIFHLYLSEVATFLKKQSKLIKGKAHKEVAELRQAIDDLLALSAKEVEYNLINIVECNHLNNALIKKILNHDLVRREVVEVIVENKKIKDHIDDSDWQLAYRALREPELNEEGKIIGEIDENLFINGCYMVATREQIARHRINKQLAQTREVALENRVVQLLRKLRIFTALVEQVFNTELSQ